jgi:hypothetical protein
MERSVEPPEVPKEIEYPDLAQAVPTKSRKSSRHSLPADLQVPADIKFEPLRMALARETHRRRRYTEGLATGTIVVEDTESDTFIEPADLDLHPSDFATPKRSLALVKHTPLSINRVHSPNDKRENEIFNYENAIKTIIEEKAVVAANLKNVQLAVRSLGFGNDELNELEICAEIRVAFDELRSQEAEMSIDVDFENMTNLEIIKCQADIVRGVLDDLHERTKMLDDTEDRLALTRAEYVSPLSHRN